MTSSRHPAEITPITVRRYGGNGPCVVLLHGGPGAPGEMAPVAERLEDRFTVIEPFQRNSGELPLTVARHVLDLHQVLRLSLTEGPVRIIGFSWGAMLGLSYAARFPESVCSLILVGCGTFDETSRNVYQMNMKHRMSPEIETRIRQVNERLMIEKNPNRRNSLFAEFGSIYTHLQSVNAMSDVSEDVLYYDEAGFRETWENVLRLPGKGIQPAEFRQISSVTTMIHGEEDPHPGPMIYQSLKPFIRHLTYAAIPQCGHKPWIEQMAGEYFYDLLFEYLL